MMTIIVTMKDGTTGAYDDVVKIEVTDRGYADRLFIWYYGPSTCYHKAEHSMNSIASFRYN